ncbi:cupin domain-containing protein [Methylocystis bryophila]|uniref:Cupin n=1 Tax=Methylocystis bryophila TaxID=655015 RepID=A0A1W6MVH2_9HYPH|nr:cupin domain-containing protein [Methylocystis bryophila]ARN81582.1 cupin [Methylocystis bryophila]BDV37622.1 cupin [Methylocystis bryophila]
MDAVRKPKDQPTPCAVIRAAENATGKQGLTFKPGVSAQSVGATGIYLELLTIPPGGRAKAHKHVSHETAIYMISGEATTYWGERLENKVETRAGDFVYIGANVPHLPVNTGSEPAVAVVARTDPDEQESVELLPHLDALAP